VEKGTKGAGGEARGQGSKSTLSSTRTMMAVDKRKNVKGSCGLWPVLWATGTCIVKKTLVVGSHGWAVWRGGGQWQFSNLKFNKFFREGSEALRMMIGVDTVIIGGNGNVVVRESKAV